MWVRVFRVDVCEVGRGIGVFFAHDFAECGTVSKLGGLAYDRWEGYAARVYAEFVDRFGGLFRKIVVVIVFAFDYIVGDEFVYRVDVIDIFFGCGVFG